MTLISIQNRHNVTREFLRHVQDVLEAKSKDYSHDGTPYQDFDAVAAATGMSREAVCFAFMMKHVTAVGRWVQSGQMEYEGIQGRLQDIVGYAAILASMDPSEGLEPVDGKEKGPFVPTERSE